jgi:hypothetical protein
VEFAGQSVTATLKFFQERGETFRDRLVDGIVPGPEPLPVSRSHGISASMPRRSD